MPNSVVIDGVIYVPVMKSSPDMEKIARGLMMDFWGEIAMDMEKAMDGLSVRVYDDGEGLPIKEVLANIAQQLAK